MSFSSTQVLGHPPASAAAALDTATASVSAAVSMARIARSFGPSFPIRPLPVESEVVSVMGESRPSRRRFLRGKQGNRRGIADKHASLTQSAINPAVAAIYLSNFHR